jgi:hypothetical protein
VGFVRCAELTKPAHRWIEYGTVHDAVIASIENTLVISGTITAAMEALLIGPIVALSFAATMLVGKALLIALITAIERTSKSSK